MKVNEFKQMTNRYNGLYRAFCWYNLTCLYINSNPRSYECRFVWNPYVIPMSLATRRKLWNRVWSNTSYDRRLYQRHVSRMFYYQDVNRHLPYCPSMTFVEFKAWEDKRFSKHVVGKRFV